MSDTITLTLQCDDQQGIVSDVAGYLCNHDCNIIDAQQFNDGSNNRFFMRVEFIPHSTKVDALKNAFEELAEKFNMAWHMRSAEDKPKVLLMVSKFDHCLGDLLYRWRLGELDMEVVGIVSNHPQEIMTTSLIGQLPYHHLPITKDTKPQQEAQIKQIVDDTCAELVVLARYMQILSDDMSAYLSGRCIVSVRSDRPTGV